MSEAVTVNVVAALFCRASVTVTVRKPRKVTNASPPETGASNGAFVTVLTSNV